MPVYRQTRPQDADANKVTYQGMAVKTDWSRKQYYYFDEACRLVNLHVVQGKFPFETHSTTDIN